MLLAFLLAAAILAAEPASQPSSPPPENPCAKWTLNGYTLGMTQDAAYAVRPARHVKSTLGLRPGFRKAFVDTDVGGTMRIRGTLIFDPAGLLAEWITRPGEENYTELRWMLVQKLGQPQAEDASAGSPGVMPDDSHEVLWASAECGAEIKLLTMGAGFLQVAVVGLSAYPRRPLE